MITLFGVIITKIYFLPYLLQSSTFYFVGNGNFCLENFRPTDPHFILSLPVKLQIDSVSPDLTLIFTPQVRKHHVIFAIWTIIEIQSYTQTLAVSIKKIYFLLLVRRLQQETNEPSSHWDFQQNALSSALLCSSRCCTPT